MGDAVAVHMMARCIDAAGLPRPWPALAARRRRTPCEGCGEICWYDPESIIAPTAKMLCVQCAVEHARDDPEGVVGCVPRRAADELRRELPALLRAKRQQR
jgi:hypothetical protein